MAEISHIFVNCPFDEEYQGLLRPLLFTIVVAGFQPRIASERSDSGEMRLTKICGLIGDSVAAIHDLSRLQAQKVGEFYRLNMAFELGLTYGHRVFAADGSEMRLLVLEADRFDYMKALSDFSGMDIKNHDDDPATLVLQVRNWFVETMGVRRLKPGKQIWYEFMDFMAAFYDAREAEGYEDQDLQTMPISEFVDFMKDWVADS